MAQSMKELSVTDPPLLPDQFVMHDGDVSCRATEADPSQLEPEPQRFPEGWALHRAARFILRYPGP
jgi:hypothetical protein